jgi:feruloyl-CoA synthase
VSGRVVTSALPLAPYAACIGDDLVRWAGEAPHRPFIRERADGSTHSPWRSLTFGAALARARGIGGALLEAGFSAEEPLAIVAENGIDHAVVALAALHVGVPIGPLSTGYARADADPRRLQTLLDVLRPKAVYAPDERVAARIAAAVPAIPVIRDLARRNGDPARADAAFARITPDTVAKILFTSGSTGLPKGVITTQRMMCANQTMLAQAWPHVTRNPVLVDWMPWSHVASGNKVFNLVLRHGGTLYVDAGRPLPGAFATTVANLREIAPTVYFTVPRGYALLAESLATDAELAQSFFSQLRGLVNAGASIPSDVRRQMLWLSASTGGKTIPVISPYGATETAPMASAVWGDPQPDVESIGLPVPGVEIKLAPFEDRLEICVRGPNVTPGYWRNAAATAAAFDEQGYYKTGDAGDFIDPDRPARGLVFRGRLAENFKLSSGTWVNVGAVRVALIEAGGGLVEDAVITGRDRDDLGALVFFGLERARQITGVLDGDRAALAAHPALRAAVGRVLAAHNEVYRSSTTRIAKAILQTDGPDRSSGELTDKGTVNQRIALERRAALVAALYELQSTLAVIAAPSLALEPNRYFRDPVPAPGP